MMSDGIKHMVFWYYFCLYKIKYTQVKWLFYNFKPNIFASIFICVLSITSLDLTWNTQCSWLCYTSFRNMYGLNHNERNLLEAITARLHAILIPDICIMPCHISHKSAFTSIISLGSSDGCVTSKLWNRWQIIMTHIL